MRSFLTGRVCGALKARRTRSLRRTFLQVLVGTAFAMVGSALQAQTTLTSSDVYITGFNANAPDGFGFVLLRNVAAGTDIRFTDNGFLAAASANAASNARGGENFLRWVAPAGGLTAGSVVTYVNGTGMGSVSTGTLPSITGSASGLNGISSGGDQIFIYQGSGTGTSTTTMDFVTNSNPTTFTGTILNGLTFQGDGTATSWLTTGTASSNTSYLPTQLTGLNANTALAGLANRGNYSGVRTGLTASAYGFAISNSSNWTTGSGTGTVALTGTNFTIASSANLNWDANGTTAGTGGTGTWDTTTQNRFSFSDGSNTSFMPWVNSSAGNAHSAVFGGTAGTVSIGASGVTASGLDFQTTGYTIQNNTITLSGTTTPTLNVGTGVSATVNSVLAGSNGLLKTGDGLLLLGGANTYTGGTMVSGGILNVTGSLAAQNFSVASGATLTSSTTLLALGANTINGSVNGAFNLQSGATLSGSGTITGATTISGALAPGNSIGTINNVGNVTWNGNGAAWVFEVGALNSSDLLNITGDFNKGTAGTFTFDFVGADVLGTYKLVDWTGGTTFSASDFSFTGLDVGNVGSFAISGTQLNFSITAVPEPTSMVLVSLVGVAGVAFRARRRKTKNA